MKILYKIIAIWVLIFTLIFALISIYNLTYHKKVIESGGDENIQIANQRKKMREKAKKSGGYLDQEDVDELKRLYEEYKRSKQHND